MSSDLAKPAVVEYAPALTADTDVAPEDVVGIDGALDFHKSLVVVAPVLVLPVGLIWAGLLGISCISSMHPLADRHSAA